jgi:hypothetical protein
MLFDVTSSYDDLLLVSEAARVLGLSAQRLRTLADEGHVACVRTPFGRLFERAELERFRGTRGPFGRYRLRGQDAGSDHE